MDPFSWGELVMADFAVNQCVLMLVMGKRNFSSLTTVKQQIFGSFVLYCKCHRRDKTQEQHQHHQSHCFHVTIFKKRIIRIPESFDATENFHFPSEH